MARRIPAERRRGDAAAPSTASALKGVVALAALFVAVEARAATERATLSATERAALVDRSDLYLEAMPLSGEGLYAFSRRLTGDTAAVAAISKLNRNPRKLLSGVRYRVPYEHLTADRRLAVIRALFPRDRTTAEAWIHRSRGESLERVALWLTGSATHAAALRKVNGRTSDRVREGEEIRVPRDMLLQDFRPREPPPAPVGRAPGEEAPRLEYGEDGLGPFAIYRLRGGEALYSAVVVRLTGRVHAEDVNALAREIAVRSGIVDVTDIPIGYPVKVPLDLLQPEFLPPGDPRRLEWEVERALAATFKNEVKARGLAGVTVILDAGHGGADVGASMAGVWESNYVYDTVLRIKRRLENETHARVVTTTRDGDSFTIADRDVLPFSRGHKVMTTPPYVIGDSVVGVHLRWYLANSLYRKAAAEGGRDKVIFISVHADSLHPSIRGATVYVPDVAGTAGTFGKGGSVFESRKEYRDGPRVSFSLESRQQAEGLSRDLAGRILGSFREAGLAIHPFQPIRDRIYRGKRAWVPAVLRYNAVPPRLLLEICNLANTEDRRLLQTREFREKVAASVVDGILAFFGEKR